MKVRCLPLLVVAAVAVAACGPERKASEKSEQAALGGEIVARVGSETIPKSLVAEVARTQQVTPAEAARRLIDDAVAAVSAKERGLDAAPSGRWRLTAARARLTSQRLLQNARAAGPPTDREIAELSEIHWVQVDRPPTVRVIHALVKRPSRKEAEGDARAFAAALRTKLATTTSEDDFKAQATEEGKAAKGQGLEVVVESLAPFEAGGKMVEGGTLVEPFAKAAHALATAGDTSGIVETEFGFHVIRLLERLPEQRMPMENRRVAFADEVVTRRARSAYETLIASLRAQTPVEVLPSAETSMRELHGAERRP